MQTIRQLAIISLSVAAFGVSCMAAEITPKAFFRPAKNLSRDYNPDELYPRGQVFPFGFYGLNISRDKIEGLTLIGPYGRENNVADAKQHGPAGAKPLKCTYSISLPMDFHGEKPLELTPDQIRRQIAQQVEEAAGNPEIAWWYLGPEELRHWRKNELTYLEVAAQTIRETDPLGRPIWMYDPGHRDAAALAYTAKHLDICGKGMYTNYAGQRDNRVWVRWTIEQEIGAIEEANPSAIPIAVPEMFQDPPEELLPMIPRWVRHDVYLSLISGAKGIMIFSGWRRAKFSTFDRYHQAYAECAREINGPLNLGAVFLFGERRTDIKVRVTSGPVRVATAHKKPVEYPSVAMLDVSHGENRYLFLANSASQPVGLEVEGLPRAPIGVEDLFDNDQKPDLQHGRFEMELQSLAVKAYRFSLADVR